MSSEKHKTILTRPVMVNVDCQFDWEMLRLVKHTFECLGEVSG